MGFKLGDFEFVPASELGYKDSDFTVDREYFNNEMYDFYKEQCQGPLADIDSTYEEEVEPDLDSDKLTCFGRIGMYQWCSLTSIYSKYNYKKLTEAQDKQNLYHMISIATGGYQLGGKLIQALNNNASFINYMRNPIVLNTEEAVPIGFSADVAGLSHCLSRALQQEHHKIMTLTSQSEGSKTYSFNASLLAGKDVIIPFVIAEPGTLRLYYHLADAVCHRYKANTAYGVFVTRIKPSLDGKMPSAFEEEYIIPPITAIDFWGNILSQLEDTDDK